MTKSKSDREARADRRREDARGAHWKTWAWLVGVIAVIAGVFGLDWMRQGESTAEAMGPKLNATAAPGEAPEGMVWVPGGRFWMGDNSVDDARPEHLVYV